MGKRGPKAKAVDETLMVQAIAECRSIAGVLRRVGLVPRGGNYRRVKWVVKKFGLDTSHWAGQGHRKGSTKPMRPPSPLARFLVFGTPCCTSRLRKRLIDYGLLAARCSVCRLDRWLGRPLPLELDHIDGDAFNNLFVNLRLLCPNCHALTPTYRGRNIKASPGGGIGQTPSA